MTEYNFYQLAVMAGTTHPDNAESPGALFLTRVAEATAEAWAEADDVERRDYQDMAHGIADGCVPVGTWDLWRTFLDLGAWDAGDEAAEDMGGEGPTGPFSNDHGDGMTAWAAVALYSIAARLADAILAELGEADDDDDDDEPDLRTLASEWHGGQWSALYAYASTGTVLPTLATEVRRIISHDVTMANVGGADDHRDDLPALRALLAIAEVVEAEADAIADAEAGV